MDKTRSFSNICRINKIIFTIVSQVCESIRYQKKIMLRQKSEKQPNDIRAKRDLYPNIEENTGSTIFQHFSVD
jgi:hypothetical protein